MNNQQNKHLFLLSLFLLAASATQCMDNEHDKPQQDTPTVKPITIVTLTKERDELKKLLLDNNTLWQKRLLFAPDGYTLIMCMYPKETHLFYNHIHTILLSTPTIIPFNCTADQLRNMNNFKKALCGEYSAIGGITMAEEISLQEKIEFIQRLLDADFKIRPGDKKLAFIEKWERCEPIRQKIYLLLSAKQHDLKCLLPMPLELIHYITRLMFEPEKSLF